MRLRVVAAIACVFVLVSLVFEPAALGSPDVSTGAASAATSAEAAATDQGLATVPSIDPYVPPPDGPAMGDGGVDWSLVPPSPQVDPIAGPPAAGETDDSYYYSTVYGNYTFSKAAPHRMRLRAAAGALREQGGTVRFWPEYTRAGTYNPRHVEIWLGEGGSPFGQPHANPVPKGYRIG